MIQVWDDNLAYKSEQVRLCGEDSSTVEGYILGLPSDGTLRIHNERVE